MTKLKKGQKLSDKNYIYDNYVAKELDREWCCDYTAVGHTLILAVIDLSTRLIIGCQVIFKSEFKPFDGDASKNLILFVEEIINKRSIVPVIFHSDSGGTFISQEFRDFLKAREINQSFSIHRAFGNQVIERWNRTFKDRIRIKLRERFGSSELRPSQDKKILNFVSKLSDDEIKKLVLDVVEDYNNSKHSHLEGQSPYIMEEALLLHASRTNYPALTPVSPSDVPLTVSSTTPDTFVLNKEIKDKTLLQERESTILQALDPLVSTSTRDSNHALIKSFKKAAVKDLSDHWYAFLLELSNFFSQKLDTITETLTQNQRETISAITASKDATIENLRTESDRVIASQTAELLLLRTQIEDQGKILSLLEDEQIARKFNEKRRLEIAEHRRNRARKPLRDAASLPEVNLALNSIDNTHYRSEFARSRDRLALLILYVTGLRIGNLLLFTSNNLFSLLEPNDADRILHVQLIKTGSKACSFSFPIAKEYYNILIVYKDDFLALQQGKEGEDLVFTAEGRKTPLERSWLTNRINNILKEVNKTSKKKLSSHSLRIGHVNALIDQFGIEVAQKLVNHQDIKTTSAYARNFLTKRDIERNLKKVAKRKEQRFKRHKEISIYSNAFKQDLSETPEEDLSETPEEDLF